MTRNRDTAGRAAAVLCAAAVLTGTTAAPSERLGRNVDSDTLSVIDTRTSRTTATVRVGDGPTGVAN
ncbi:hypothetical protein [Streptomyces sp. A0592]|uniref:hypothetical protein n=1 Tax=Streptomyces sp. A0592 TaxID=2563099 RepID=UPI00109E8411|nr:hypothetical protein [Streptomyces sp. A0592]THA78752.1 hypothetical protein E6U81_32895 [Streptomyces sp. A0592]